MSFVFFWLILATAVSSVAQLPGEVDRSFDSGSAADGPVNAVLVLPDGKVLVGGDFTTIKDTPRKGLARFDPDGSIDKDFDPGATGGITSMVLQPDGKVLLGGWFTVVDGVVRWNIARLHGREAPPQHGLGSASFLPDGRFCFRLSGEPGRPCTIQTSSHLVRWVDLKTVVPTSASIEVTDSPAPSDPQRFYRFRVDPP
jgi:hypothetical protein